MSLLGLIIWLGTNVSGRSGQIRLINGIPMWYGNNGRMKDAEVEVEVEAEGEMHAPIGARSSLCDCVVCVLQ